MSADAPRDTTTPASTTGRADDRWHALDAGRVAEAHTTGPQGLTDEEAAARLARDGPNELPEQPPTSALVVLLHQFTSPLIYILVAATIVTLALAEYIDAAVIAAVLALNAVIGYTQERRAERSVRALMQLLSPHARVLRGGREREIESRELVRGDVVLLESGVRVPADLRLLSATALRIDESLLTGESLPVTKTAETLHRGRSPPGRAPQHGLHGDGGRQRTRAGVRGRDRHRDRGGRHRRGDPHRDRDRHAAAAPDGALRARRRSRGGRLGPPRLRHRPRDGRAGIAHVLGGRGAGRGAVPEGLPVVFTITLALGVRRMAHRRAIVRRLPAVETLGSTTVIGSDKTGTLTENRMTVREVWAGGRHGRHRRRAPGRRCGRSPPARRLSDRTHAARRRADQRGEAVPRARPRRALKETRPRARCSSPPRRWDSTRKRCAPRTKSWRSCRSSRSGSTRRACAGVMARTCCS
jgi:magnesium-transporting ATPase (P-type)